MIAISTVMVIFGAVILAGLLILLVFISSTIFDPILNLILQIIEDIRKVVENALQRCKK